jgi:hypothetical protein
MAETTKSGTTRRSVLVSFVVNCADPGRTIRCPCRRRQATPSVPTASLEVKHRRLIPVDGATWSQASAGDADGEPDSADVVYLTEAWSSEDAWDQARRSAPIQAWAASMPALVSVPHVASIRLKI